MSNATLPLPHAIRPGQRDLPCIQRESTLWRTDVARTNTKTKPMRSQLRHARAEGSGSVTPVAMENWQATRTDRQPARSLHDLPSWPGPLLGMLMLWNGSPAPVRGPTPPAGEGEPAVSDGFVSRETLAIQQASWRTSAVAGVGPEVAGRGEVSDSSTACAEQFPARVRECIVVGKAVPRRSRDAHAKPVELRLRGYGQAAPRP